MRRPCVAEAIRRAMLWTKGALEAIYRAGAVLYRLVPWPVHVLLPLALGSLASGEGDHAIAALFFFLGAVQGLCVYVMLRR